MLPAFLTVNHYLGARIAGGVGVFAAMAVADLRRHGRTATRWREYLFLIFCVATACLYGAINDQISVTISWEYFYYGKELSVVLGPLATPDVAPATGPLRWQAALVGIKACWSAGLIVGAVLLIANNPSKHRTRLTYATLAREVGLVFGITVLFAALGAVAGYLGALTWADGDFQTMLHDHFARPYHFMSAWGEHLGAYIGGLLGTALAAWRIYARRARPTSVPTTTATAPIVPDGSGRLVPLSTNGTSKA